MTKPISDYVIPSLLILAGSALVGVGILAIKEPQHFLGNDDPDDFDDDLLGEPEIDAPPAQIAAANAGIPAPLYALPETPADRSLVS